MPERLSTQIRTGGEQAASGDVGLTVVSGQIKWFDASKGFGFIVPDDQGPDILLHVTCLRRDGYAAAFRNSKVQEAIMEGVNGRVAVTYVEWADTGFQRAAADWTVIASEDDALDFAARVASAPFERGHYTAIGSAIADGVRRIDDNDYTAPRLIIDISGDGPQNQGLPLDSAHALADRSNIVVNGLPVISSSEGRWVRPVEVNLEGYFRENVITGPGAFVLPARTEDEFRVAILRKLVLEIAGAMPSGPELDVSGLGRAP